MEPNEIENKLTNWDLFKSYGQFNLYFEAIVAQYRELLIELVRNYYGFVGDWEDPETLEIIDSDFQDRLLKIILNDNGAMAIVEKCKSCFVDSLNPNVQKVLIENNITPLNFSEFDIKIADLLFKKILELIKLRNVIIHSHYDGLLFNFFPVVKLKGSKDVKTTKGYEQRNYEYTVKYLNDINLSLEELWLISFKFKTNASISEGSSIFIEEDVEKLKKMNFLPPLK